MGSGTRGENGRPGLPGGEWSVGRRFRKPSEEERVRHAAFADLCRETVERAHVLGFAVDDLMDALLDYRALERE